MKKVFLLMALACACVFTSCKKDDDSPKEPTASLIGKWEIREDLIQQNGQWVNCNPKHKEGGGHYWEFSSTKLTLKDPCEITFDSSVEYSYNATTQELTHYGFVSKVEKLTNTEMILINSISKRVFKKMN